MAAGDERNATRSSRSADRVHGIETDIGEDDSESPIIVATTATTVSLPVSIIV